MGEGQRQSINSSNRDQALKIAMKGNKALVDGNFDKAIDHYTLAIRLDPKNPTFYSNRSAVWGAKKDYEASIKDANESIRLDPKGGVKGYTRLAAAQISLNQWEEAGASIQKGLSKEHGNRQLLRLQVKLKQLREETAKAEAKEALEAVQKNPKVQANYVRLATAEIEAGDLDAAKNTIKYGLKLDAKNLELLKLSRTVQTKNKPLERLGTIRFQLGDSRTKDHLKKQPMPEPSVRNLNVKDTTVKPTQESIAQHFPRALSNTVLVDRVFARLAKFGYGKTSVLLATSLCCDEVNKPLIDDFSSTFGGNFNMGGLAGFAFGGVTSFGAMAHHIPDGGSCLVVFGPHVGVDSNGKVGTVDRRGRDSGGACCGSACAAAGYVASKGADAKEETITDALDAQQTFVNNMLLPQASRLADAQNTMVELPFALYDAQKDLMERIVAKGCSNVGGNGKIALLGGIQINTPEAMQDYFLPLTFLLKNNKDELMEDLLWED